MILRRVQGREVLEVGLDLGAIGDLETDRTEQGFDTFERARHRMQTAALPAAAGQVTSSASSASRAFERQLPDRFAAGVERRFDGFLGAIDRRAGGLALVRRQLGQPLSNSVIWPLLPRSGLDLLKRVRVVGRRKGEPPLPGLFDRGCAWFTEKKEARASFPETVALGVELGLGLHGQSSKSRLVENRQIGQHLAVDLDLRLLQAIHEGAVFHAEFPGRRIDAGNPEAAELTLPCRRSRYAYWPAFITACLATR
jgi:hypothetical protein